MQTGSKSWFLITSGEMERAMPCREALSSESRWVGGDLLGRNVAEAVC